MQEPYDIIQDYTVATYRNGQHGTRTYTACTEKALCLFVNDQPFVRIACSGLALEELVLGFLFSSGAINTRHDIADLSITHTPQECHAHVRLATMPQHKPATLTSALGWTTNQPLAPLPPASQSWSAQAIMKAAARLEESSHIFHRTGACHNALLLDRQGERFFAFDIGRHNAIDMIIGATVRHDWDRSQLLLVSSGRIASEIVHKVLRAGFPIFASLSRAMARSITMAREHGLTLLGNVSPQGFDIYHNAGNLSFDTPPSSC